MESRQRRVGLTRLALHAAAHELDARLASRRRCGGEAHGVERHVQPRTDALRQRGVCEIDDGRGEARISNRRARERFCGFRQVILTEHLPDVFERHHTALTDGKLGEAEAVPRIGPLGTQLARPFEFSGRVVVMRFVFGDRAESIRDEPEPQMDERIITMLLGRLDRSRFDACQRDAVGDKTERIAQRFNRDAIGW